MPEILEKLRPDRDLQCYFERPSAVAAISEASATGFAVTGSFRQQFDWVVLEWNRDNTFEHPSFRNLPDGDLSGLTLCYEETRNNCIPLDSDLFPTLDWPYLRIWLEGDANVRYIRLKDYATAIEGSYQPAAAEFELKGTVTPGDYVGLTWLTEHHTYQVIEGDTVESVVRRIAESVNAFSETADAVAEGGRIRIRYLGPGQTPENSTTGANGNRIGAYGYVEGSGEWWEPAWQRFSGGTSPSKWRITLNFGALLDRNGNPVPMSAVRKMRWTYAADLQQGEFQRCEFEVRISNWAVTGAGRTYAVAGPKSRRLDDGDTEITYFGKWAASKGNFFGGTIRSTNVSGAGLSCTYSAAAAHSLYLGTRKADNGAVISVSIDGGPAQALDLRIPAEDVLVRVLLGELGPGNHTVTITRTGPQDSRYYFYFDFLEIAVRSETLPEVAALTSVSPATDWDTDHSMALAPERTAWMIHSLGFRGRVNHYVGALWFYELHRPGHTYASATVRFSGTPQFSAVTEIRIGRDGEPPESDTVLTHLNLKGETAETIAKAFELEINRGYMAIRAEADGAMLRISARAMGTQGNRIRLAVSPTSGPFVLEASGDHLSGGQEAQWRTDLTASPRLNRAARDWHRSYFHALRDYGFDVVSALSLELQHGDPSEAAGIAQRYPDGEPVLLNTPALQTNFSPASLAFWKEVYRELAALMNEAGLQPYLQFGEVQWWYFPNASGMPFYDQYTREGFRAAYGREMVVITNGSVPPSQHPEEAEYLRGLVGSFTDAVMAHVRQSLPACRFEVLYPTDVNEPPFNQAVNLPSVRWTPQALDCFKTEGFTHTFARNLDKVAASLELHKELGFPAHKRAHLIGVSDPTTPWLREMRLARAQGLASVVLFALDQFCLVGYPVPLPRGPRRAAYMG